MNFSIRILFFSMIIFEVQSVCEEGCLKCNKLDLCEICDSTNFYYSSQSGCTKSEIDNCYILDQKNNCLQCKEQHVLDTATLKCV